MEKIDELDIKIKALEQIIREQQERIYILEMRAVPQYPYPYPVYWDKPVCWDKIEITC
jgi:restriction endonuclease S subunit